MHATIETMLAAYPAGCPTRRSEVEANARDAGIEGDALAFIASLGASERHAWRVGATLRAALEAADSETYPTASEDAEARQALAVAWALVALDIDGVGGPRGMGGAGGASGRMPWARTLGKGRWQASDGRAWEAAAVEAREALVRALGETPHLAVDELPYGEKPVATLVVRAGQTACSITKTVPLAWEAAEARRQIASAYAERRYDRAAPWGRLLNATEKSMRARDAATALGLALTLAASEAGIPLPWPPEAGPLAGWDGAWSEARGWPVHLGQAMASLDASGASLCAMALEGERSCVGDETWAAVARALALGEQARRVAREAA